MILTINHNGFHGTNSVAIRVDANRGKKYKLTDTQQAKLSRVVCGLASCSCGEGALNDPEDGGNMRIFVPREGNEIDIRGQYPQG